MQFQRNQLSYLKEWVDRKRRKPLVVLGARQVGKSTLLQHFAETHFEEHVYINFETDHEYHELFETSLNPEPIVAQIRLLQEKAIDPKKCLIILDEIQECPRALTALKYFNEKAPEYAVIAVGSLLGLTIGKNRSFPVGKVNFMNLYPLTFKEFLAGVDEKAYDIYEHFLKQGIQPLPATFHDVLVNAFKQYTISGGMPEAAKAMANGASNSEIKEVLREIENAYKLDFSKHAPSPIEGAKVQYVWDSIPSQLSKENKKFMYKAIRTGARAREYEVALLWLEQAGIVHKIYRTEKPYYPLSAYDDLSAFKLYTVDLGILSRRADLDHHQLMTPSAIYREFKGALAENYVCQALVPQYDAAPRYWKSSGIAEVDFIIQHDNLIIPIEVKSNVSTKSKSLSSYTKQYDPKLRVRISLNNLKLDNGLLNLPIYFADDARYWIGKALNN